MLNSALESSHHRGLLSPNCLNRSCLLIGGAFRKRIQKGKHNPRSLLEAQVVLLRLQRIDRVVLHQHQLISIAVHLRLQRINLLELLQRDQTTLSIQSSLTADHPLIVSVLGLVMAISDRKTPRMLHQSYLMVTKLLVAFLNLS